jgi:glutaredoxin
MKDKFGHLRDEGDDRTQEEELRGAQEPEERRDDQFSEEFQTEQEEKLDQIQNQEDFDREDEIRRDNDIEDPAVEIGIKDIDRAITYELDENFDFHVKQNNKRIKVPVIWDNQERWTWARQRRNLKSVKDKVLLPLIVIERTDFGEHPSLVTRPDITTLNSTGRQFTVRQRYSKRNRYDQFTALQNSQPEREYYSAPVPKYVQANYDLTIYTEYRWQMDKIADAIQFYDYTYWGNEEEGTVYYTKVDSINQSIEMSDEARYVQSDISLTTDGYVLPDELKDGEPVVTKSSSPSKIRFSEEAVEDADTDPNKF